MKKKKKRGRKKKLLLDSFVLFIMLFCLLFRFIYFIVLGVGSIKEGGCESVVEEKSEREETREER